LELISYQNQISKAVSSTYCNLSTFERLLKLATKANKSIVPVWKSRRTQQKSKKEKEKAIISSNE